MAITEKDAKRIVLIVLFGVLTVLTFLIVRPVILSIFGGLILAYICFPIYKIVVRYVKWEGLSAAIVSIIIVAIIFVPMWFLVPMVITQTFGIFQQSQTLEITSVITKILPTASEQLVQQIDLTLKSAISKVSSSVLTGLLGLLTNFATIVLQAVIVAFVFFFALKDEARLRKFVSEISPLNKTQEKLLVTQFKDMTNSILYGHVVAGVIQGVLAGIAILVFGIPNAVLLTILAIIFGVVPILGPGLVYVPATIYLIALGQPGPAIIYFLYNVIVVSSIDNLFRIYLVSRKVKISQVIVLVGMVGGLLLFGFLGLLIGPLVLGYFITLVEAYKNKTLTSFFSEE